MANYINLDTAEDDSLKAYDERIAQLEKDLVLLKLRRRINDEFNERVDKILKGDKDYRPLELGKPCKILLSCGLSDLPIQMAITRLIDKKLQANHPFDIKSVFNMPDSMVGPIAVFQSKTRPECKVVLTDMQDAGIHLIVAIEQNRASGHTEVNSVRSVYPKDNIKDIMKWIIEDKLMQYCEKEKALKWLGKQQSNSADVTRLLEGSTKIVKSFINPPH